MYQAMIKKKKGKPDKTILLVKQNLNNIIVFTPKALID